MTLFLQHRLYFAWLISLAAVFMSLFYGEIVGVEPCRLCWYQRICMFPLALFLGIAWYKKDEHLANYTLPLVIVGALIAFYQCLSQLFPHLAIFSFCSGGTSCSLFSIFPFLSLLAFILIGALILCRPKRGE